MNWGGDRTIAPQMRSETHMRDDYPFGSIMARQVVAIVIKCVAAYLQNKPASCGHSPIQLDEYFWQ